MTVTASVWVSVPSPTVTVNVYVPPAVGVKDACAAFGVASVTAGPVPPDRAHA